ncbi:MAG: hypothetical protein Q7L55_01850 [Actinomycetota bacterium]|nr:hypothetical protein [Actinomycetota bacterium]
MKRTLAVTMGLALALTLAACGGNSSDAGTIPDRDALIADLRADGEKNGAPTEQIDCVVDAISELDAAQLQSVKDGTPDAATLAVMTAASDKCIPKDSPSPAAS